MEIEEYLRKQLKSCISQQFHVEGDIWLVPCLVNYIENTYKPLLKPLNTSNPQNKLQNKQGWTILEEEVLLKTVISRGTKAWSSIAKELNAIAHNGEQVRAGRHCREHWYNHVDPSLIKGNWTEEEDNNLLDLYKTLGNHWSDIAKQVKGRTENSVKNRVKSLLKKKGIKEEDVKKSSPKIGFRQEIIENQTPLDCMMLMSPKIVNFDISENTEQSPKFFMPSAIEIRPRIQRLPGVSQISQTRDILRRDALLDSTFSPSLFLR